MKKFLFISLLLIIALGTASCFNQNASRIYINDNPDDSENPDGTGDEAVGKDSNERINNEPINNDAKLDELEEGSADDESEGETEDEEMSETPAQNTNIIIETPLPNSTVQSPFEVAGQARVFEGTVLVRVKNQDGKIVVPEQIVTAHGADIGKFGEFKIKINYAFYATKEGTIEVFSQSAVDGSEINMVEVPVKFE